MKKVVHYINQFFAGLGGEDTADLKAEIRVGTVGPGTALEEAMGVKVTHTIVCGDNYMGTHKEKALSEIEEMLKDLDFDLLVAGPAFQAGRYGVACGNVSKMVKERLNKEAISSMHEENPGVEMFRNQIYILRGGKSAAAMRKDLKKVAKLGQLIIDGKTVGPADEYDYFPTGRREQVFLAQGPIAARRGVDMLVKKLNGQSFQTELVIEPKKLVPIAPELTDLSKARIAILNTGGIVPVDNPDRIQSASATRWGRYDISSMDRLKSGEFKTIHAGFDPAAANADPNRILPLDALKILEKEGVYGSLHPYFYSTVGTGTTQKEAARMGREIVKLLEEDKVDGAIMVST